MQSGGSGKERKWSNIFRLCLKWNEFISGESGVDPGDNLPIHWLAGPSPVTESDSIQKSHSVQSCLGVNILH
jgi:hypothetical protein